MNPRASWGSRLALYIILFILIAIFASNYLSPKIAKIKDVSISDIVRDVNDGKVDSVSVKDNQVTANLKDGSKELAYKETTAELKDYDITANKVAIQVDNTANSVAWWSILSALLPVLLIGGFIWFMFRSAQGSNMKAMNFGKSRAKIVGTTKVSFEDVAGLVEPKQELYESLNFCANRQSLKS